VSRRLGLGAAAALLLVAPALPSVAGAAEPVPAPPAASEPDSENEGTGQAHPPSGQDEDRAGSDVEDTDSDQTEENSPSLVAPEDTSKPDEGENESGPVETAPPQDETDLLEQQGGAPVPTTPTPPTDRAPGQPEEVTPPGGDADRGGSEGQQEAVEAPKPKERNHPPGGPTRPESRGHEDTRKGTARHAPDTNFTAPAGPRAPRSLDVPSDDRRNALNTGSLSSPGSAPRGEDVPDRKRGSAPSSSGAGIHIVQSGESLWSIAAARVGGSPAPSEVAREVERLWDLNADAIGTGDPDLLLVGQRLSLR